MNFILNLRSTPELNEHGLEISSLGEEMSTHLVKLRSEHACS